MNYLRRAVAGMRRILAAVWPGPRIEYERVRNVRAPWRATRGAAAFDLYMPDDADTVTLLGTRPRLIKLGLILAIPPGWEGQIRGRSGLAVKGVRVHPGTIDSDFREEVGAILSVDPGIAHQLRPGHRICQIAIRRAPSPRLCEVPAGTLRRVGDREGGFGHTGE